jgi:pimeloyl-ACP methyl ester carboxylesterase
MEMYSDDINGLMDFLKIEQANVIGVSLGGMIVLNFVLKYPKRVNKLVLMNTFPGFPNTQGLELYSASKIQYYKDLKKNPIETFLNSSRAGYSREYRKLMEKDPKRKFYGLWSLEDLINNDLADPMTLQDIKNASAAIAKHNVTDRLHEIRSKTLVLCAEKDRLATVSINKLIHERIPNSELKIIMGAGHGSNLEKAPEVNKILVTFLKE